MFSLCIAFLKVGCVSIGGGYAMLPIIYQVVDTHGIMTRDDFSNLVAISQITPGPVSINAATYAGFESYGWQGALLTSLMVCLPCTVFSCFATTLLQKNESTIVINSILDKMKIAGVALITVSGLFLAEGSIFMKSFNTQSWIKQIDFFQVVLCLATFILFKKRVLGPVSLTFIMGGSSMVFYLIFPYFQGLCF